MCHSGSEKSFNMFFCVIILRYVYIENNCISFENDPAKHTTVQHTLQNTLISWDCANDTVMGLYYQVLR